MQKIYKKSYTLFFMINLEFQQRSAIKVLEDIGVKKEILSKIKPEEAYRVFIFIREKSGLTPRERTFLDLKYGFSDGIMHTKNEILSVMSEFNYRQIRHINKKSREKLVRGLDYLRNYQY